MKERIMLLQIQFQPDGASPVHHISRPTAEYEPTGKHHVAGMIRTIRLSEMVCILGGARWLLLPISCNMMFSRWLVFCSWSWNMVNRRCAGSLHRPHHKYHSWYRVPTNYMSGESHLHPISRSNLRLFCSWSWNMVNRRCAVRLKLNLQQR